MLFIFPYLSSLQLQTCISPNLPCLYLLPCISYSNIFLKFLCFLLLYSFHFYIRFYLPAIHFSCNLSSITASYDFTLCFVLKIPLYKYLYSTILPTISLICLSSLQLQTIPFPRYPPYLPNFLTYTIFMKI